MTEQTEDYDAPPTGDDTPRELVVRRKELQLEVWHARQLAAVRAEEARLNALGPELLAEMAWAAEMARSGLVPRGFRAGAKPDAVLTPQQERQAAASILVAREMGKALGVVGAAVFQCLQVVEGQVGLKPDYARGRLIEAGYDIEDIEISNRHGFPVAHTVQVTDPSGKGKAVTYHLAYALRGGMLDSVQLADGTVVNPGQPFTDADVVGVRARSQQGKALPWETFTHNMLRHGADREYIRRYALHVTGGMIPLTAGFEGEEAPRAREPQSLGAIVREVAGRNGEVCPKCGFVGEHTPSRCRQRNPNPEPAYDPQADVDLIREKTGSGDWRPHVGAQERGVRRRSKVEMAADRIAEWARDHPNQYNAWVRHGGDEPDPVATQPHGAPEPVLQNPPAGVEHPAADSEPVDAEVWYDPDDTADADEFVDLDATPGLDHHLVETRDAWAAAADLLGDPDAAHDAVLTWVRSHRDDSFTRWEELDHGHVNAWLAAMEPDNG